MARILAISSQVARGAIGLSAAVPAMQALGHEVIALPTVLLSNHPGHARFAGERVAPDLIRRMLDALAANGWLGAIDAVLTGYLPSLEHVVVAREAIERVRSAGARAIHLCDPILGDEPKGLYIAHEAAEAIRDSLVPLADVLKMNRFECGWLAGESVAGAEDVARVARRQSWRAAIVTSLPAGEAGVLSNVIAEEGRAPTEICVAVREHVPKGTGDLMSGLLLGHLLRDRATLAEAFERAVAGVDIVILRSAGSDELQLAACLRELGA
jgi:pyridoxine kinase